MKSDSKRADDINSLIEMIVDIKLKEYKINNDRIGTIKEVLGDGLYNVEINKSIKKVPGNEQYQVNDIVIVHYYNGDENRKFIMCKKPKHFK